MDRVPSTHDAQVGNTEEGAGLGKEIITQSGFGGVGWGGEGWQVMFAALLVSPGGDG